MRFRTLILIGWLEVSSVSVNQGRKKQALRGSVGCDWVVSFDVISITSLNRSLPKPTAAGAEFRF